MRSHKRSKNRNQIDIASSEVYFNYYKKTEEDPVIKKVYTDVIKSFYSSVIEDVLLKDKIFNIPEGFGTFSIRWREPVVEIDPETYEVLKNTSPVDWQSTMKYWEENEEAKRNKV